VLVLQLVAAPFLHWANRPIKRSEPAGGTIGLVSWRGQARASPQRRGYVPHVEKEDPLVPPAMLVGYADDADSGEEMTLKSCLCPFYVPEDDVWVDASSVSTRDDVHGWFNHARDRHPYQA
jgi:hypothetical protein